MFLGLKYFFLFSVFVLSLCSDQLLHSLHFLFTPHELLQLFRPSQKPVSLLSFLRLAPFVQLFTILNIGAKGDYIGRISQRFKMRIGQRVPEKIRKSNVIFA